MNWRPKVWFSLLLALLAGPFAFLYMNSIKWFWYLLVLVLSIIIIDLFTNTSFPIIWLIPIIYLVSVLILSKTYQTDGLRSWYSKWWFILLFMFFLSLFLVRAFLFEPFKIPANSMMPTLAIGNTVIVKKIGYGSYGSFGVSIYDSVISDSVKLVRGEVYVFQSSEKNVSYIKRLIGLSGDHIKISGSDIYLNNKVIETNLLSTEHDSSIYQEVLGNKNYHVRKANFNNSNQIFSVTVPQGHYFFMGDNRDNSADSRHYGSISEDDLIGRLVYVIK